MKTTLQKIFNPYLILLLFVIFIISVISIYISFDYTYKKLKALITLFYFLPCLLFFTIASIYNFVRFKKEKLALKLIVLTPIIVIILYMLYALIQLIII